MEYIIDMIEYDYKCNNKLLVVGLCYKQELNH